MATSLKASVGPWNSFQDESIRRDLHQRCYSLVAKFRVGVRDHFAEIVGRNGVADERRDDFKRNIRVGLAGKGRDLGRIKARPGFGQVETSVPRKALEKNVGKPKDRCFATRTEVSHRVKCLQILISVGNYQFPILAHPKSNFAGFKTKPWTCQG